MEDNYKIAELELVDMWLQKKEYLNEEEKMQWREIAEAVQKNVSVLKKLYQNIGKNNQEFYLETKKIEYVFEYDIHKIKMEKQWMEYSEKKIKEILQGILEIFQDIFPLGTLVELETTYQNPNTGQNEHLQLVIIQRFVRLKEMKYYFEYEGIMYPSGMLKANEKIFFSQRAIHQVVHRGYQDEKEKEFIIWMKRQTIIEEDRIEETFIESEEEKRKIAEILFESTKN